MVVYKIEFAPEHLLDGMSVILRAGPGKFVGDKDEFLVTELALKRLDERKIPYRILSGRNEYTGPQKH